MTAVAALPAIPKVVAVRHAETGRVIYALQQKQFEIFSLTPVYRLPQESFPRYIGCGGSAGGGKSYLVRAIASAVALAWPGSSSIIFRGTEKEVETNHVLWFRNEVPEEIDGVPLYRYNGEKMVVDWANGSRTYFGFLRSDPDVFTYQGAAYDCMVFDETTTYSDFQLEYLMRSLRATAPGTRPFAVFPSNPGNRGHQRYKRLFIERRYRERERASDYAFVQMHLHDNQELMQRDPDYEARLDLLPEPWRSWQRDGNWAAGAGTAFPELSWQRHRVRPFEVPPYWTWFGAFDWGYNHPWSFGLYAVSEDGTLVCVDSIRGFHQNDYDIAQTIKQCVGDRPMAEIVAGHDCWAQQRAHVVIPGPTVADLFMGLQLYLVQADIDRVNGYRQVRTRLQGPPPHDEPQLVFFDTPGNRLVMAGLERMVTSERNLEDVLKVDADPYGEGGDDDYDQVRYACSHRPVLRGEASRGGFSISASEVLLSEHDRLYRRRPDRRAVAAQPHTYEEFE
ncbi:MAG TPA: terminase family protein [Gemmatimonadales bacterium]|nr:terminase family protein [Gemmatimonadales bacterium]